MIRFSKECLLLKRPLSSYVVVLLLSSEAALLTSCAQLVTESPPLEMAQGLQNQRAPASVTIDSELEPIFQRMLHSANIYASLQLKVDQLEYTYYAGVNSVAAFDRLLDQVLASQKAEEDFQRLALEKGITPRLQALQAFSQVASEQLQYHVLRLMEVYNQPGVDEATRTRISQAFDQLGNYLRYVPDSTRIALNPWAEDLSAVMPDSTVFKNAYKHLLVGQPDELMQLSRDPRVLAHQKKMAQKVGQAPDRNVEALLPTFVRYQREQLEEQFHQSASVGRKHELSHNRSIASEPAQLEQDSALTARQLPLGSLALSFEGTVNPSITPLLINALAVNATPAMFFVTTDGGRNFNTAQRASMKAIATAGHSVQGRSARAVELPKLFDEELITAVKLNSSAITSQTGAPTRFIKAPFDADSPRVRRLLTAHGLRVVRSNIEALDWIDPDMDRVATRVLRQAKASRSGIVALKMDRPAAALITSKILDALKADPQGKKIVSLGEVKRAD
jgi:peptidoglycan/xylan/chitin deacetylase (PgdA/CDA1 family)